MPSSDARADDGPVDESSSPPGVRVVRVRGDTTNSTFLRKYGGPGCIGLVAARTPVDRSIRVLQKDLTRDGRPSLWSHSFVFEGDRVDGHAWVIESDLDLRSGSLRFGVQENRAERYADDKHYPNLAVLDFGLDAGQARKVVAAALDQLSRGTRYALGGLFKTYAAILRKQFWVEKQKGSTYCSSLVRDCFRQAGIDLAPGIALRFTTPEHLAQSDVPHRQYLLVRDP